MLAATPPFALAIDYVMNRLWQIYLPLACCLLGAALWTALLRDTGQLPDLREAVQTASYLESIRDRLQTPRAATLTDTSADLPSFSQKPATHVPVAAAAPLPESIPSESKPVVYASSEEPSRSRSNARVTFTPEEQTERVSIVRWSDAPAPLSDQPPSNEIPPKVFGALSPQDRQMANSHLHYGKILARKGATASARGEFLNALAVIAQSRDLQSGSKTCLTALQRAIRTMEEADDFHANPSGSDLDTDVATIVAGHLCQVLTTTEANRLTRVAAIQAYQLSARTDLERACGSENPLASEVLFALGRLHGLLGQAAPAQQPREHNKSITFHQAALTANPNNFASANELGVLLARKGEWAQARELLVRSVTLSPRRETWTNLATLHQHLGEIELAKLASREAELLASGQTASSPPMIRLVPPDEFESVPDTQDAGPQPQMAQQPASASTPQLR